MNDKVIPAYDDSKMHKFIWDVLGFRLTDDDFEAIQMALIEREDEHAEVNKTTRVLVRFDHGTRMPRPVPDGWKEEAHKYVDWHCARTIWMILSKYADFNSKTW